MIEGLSYSKLARLTGLSRKAVIRAIRGLESKGYIKVDRSILPGGIPAVNRYTLNHDFIMQQARGCREGGET